MKFLTQYPIYLLLSALFAHCCFIKADQQDPNNTDNKIELHQIEMLVNNIQHHPQSDYDYQATPVPENYVQLQALPTPRTFELLPYYKVIDLFDDTLIQDALDNCPQQLRDDVDDIAYFTTHIPDNTAVFKDLLNRILLVGPSGTGKTTLAYAIAYHTKRPFVFVKASSLSNEYKSSFTTIIDAIFDPLIKLKIPCVIIIDEITAFTNKMKKKNDADAGAVEYLWMKLDEAKLHNPQLLVICTANDLEKFPETMHTRFAGNLYTIESPNFERRLSMLHTFFDSLYCSAEIDASFIYQIAKNTSSLSLREINLALCKARGKARIRCEKEGSFFTIEAQEVETALNAVLEQCSDKKWKERKKYFIKKLKVAGPYIFQASLFILSSWIAYKLYCLQADQGQKNHNDSMKQTKDLHIESMKQTKDLHVESMKQTKDLQGETLSIVTSIKNGLGNRLGNEAFEWGKWAVQKTLFPTPTIPGF